MENKVLAKVNGREIKESDLNNLMRNMGQNAAYFQGPEGRARLLDELVMQELMYSEALEKNLDQDPEFIVVMNDMKKSLLQQYNLRKLFNEITITEDEIKEFFEKHKQMFNDEEMASASHILVDSEEKANEILKDIKEGLSFEEAAVKFSSCPSKDVGGALGKFGRGQMVPEFEDAVFSMKVGEISEPVKTQFGYHIIKLTDYTPGGSPSLENVYREVRERCLMAKQEQAYLDKKAELSEKYGVEKY